jgi:hypothetical protein
MAEIMGFPLGICEKHGPKLTVNGVPKCIRCEADIANAGRVLVVNDVKDPGVEAFNEKGQVIKAAQTIDHTVKQTVKSTGTQYTLESGLNEILSILSVIPMPSSMKQYKLLMSVKQKIESALQEG